MPLVASTIPNLVSGVSQQPAPARIRTSCEAMTNGLPSVVSGLIKRPPTEWVAGSIPTVGDPDDNVAVHMIDRSVSEKYILIGGVGDLKLYTADGVEQTVTYPDGKAYLPTTDMWRKLRFVTVADTTFVLNTEKFTATTGPAETRTDPSSQGTVFINQAVAAVAYAVYVDGVLVGTFTTSSNTSASTALEGTAEIARRIAADMVAKGIVSNAVAIGATVAFDITPGAKVAVDDEFGGRAMTVYTDVIQEFGNLPPSEREGRLVRVEGNLDESEGASYWVSYSEGIWTEDVGYSAADGFDPATMPHVLVKTGPSTFEFRQNNWIAREVGDTDSNGNPSFVGRTINGMFLFKGRLGFLSEENAILSEVANLENFWRTTAIQKLDSDPIDVASATGRVATLFHAAAFANELIFFSDKQQFKLTSGSTLSSATVGITPSTAFPCSPLLPPVTGGSSVYFTADGATHSVAREVIIDGNVENLVGDDIGVQVPEYVPKSLRSIAVSVTSEAFVLLSENEPDTLYVYKWYRNGEQQKVQSAWSKWKIEDADDIVGIGFLEDYLYIVYRGGAFYRFERMLVSSSVNQSFFLDHLTTKDQFATYFYTPETDLTTFRHESGFPGVFQFYNTDTGEEYAATKVSNTQYTIPGDVTGDNIIGGMNYEFRFEFSTQYLREDTPEGEGSIQDGRLQLRYMSVIYTNTSYFEAHVTQNGITKVSVFNGRVLADPDNITDVVPRDTGEFKFPVFGENENVKIELVSNEPFRCAFGSVEWSASYNAKAKRV